MTDPAFPLLVLSGPLGVGKTTIGDALSDRLSARGVAHSFVDLDALTQTYPRPADDVFGEGLALRNLRAIWPNCLGAGARNLIVARVIEDDATLAAMVSAVPGAQPTLVQLQASEATLLERLTLRERDAALEGRVRRSQELATLLSRSAPADHRVDTDGRSSETIAAEIDALVRWR